jgi:tRNA (guanine37-N1)-methyltransferase
MHISIISVLPELLESPFAHSIMKRAIQKGLVQLDYIDLRDYGKGKHQQIDDYAFGGGAGMVLMVEPIFNCINDLKNKRQYDDVIYFSPDGDLLDQKTSNYFSLKKNLILLCGHYKGVDERVREHLVTKEISIGNYVLSGGELAAAVFCDSIIRLIPGVLSDETSALTDSFQDDLLAPPVYSRPATFNNWEVPAVLQNGNAKEIDQWRTEQSIARTRLRRPGLLK